MLAGSGGHLPLLRLLCAGRRLCRVRCHRPGRAIGCRRVLLLLWRPGAQCCRLWLGHPMGCACTRSGEDFARMLQQALLLKDSQSSACSWPITLCSRRRGRPGRLQQGLLQHRSKGARIHSRALQSHSHRLYACPHPSCNMTVYCSQCAEGGHSGMAMYMHC